MQIFELTPFQMKPSFQSNVRVSNVGLMLILCWSLVSLMESAVGLYADLLMLVLCQSVRLPNVISLLASPKIANACQFVSSSSLAV